MGIAWSDVLSPLRLKRGSKEIYGCIFTSLYFCERNAEILASGAELDRLEKFRRFAQAQPRFKFFCVVFAKIKAKIPGTKMAFAGIKNETEAQNLWAYISSLDKDGKQKR